ncbi:MAG: BON domain-containing protein [Candidatus Binatia bacterium]
MRNIHILRSCTLAAGIAALALPAFAGETGKSQSFPATAPAASTGTESPGLPGSGSMHETDRTGTTGPSGSRTFSTESDAVNAEARVAKPAGDYAVTDVDRSLAVDIRTQLMGNPELAGVTEDSVHIKVNNGAVTLEGQATTAKVKDKITAMVNEIAGVQSVTNQMEILAKQEAKQ